MSATTANYGSDEIFDRLKGLRLAPAIIFRFEKYSDDMALKGRTFAFRDGPDAPIPQLEVAETAEDDEWMNFEEKSKSKKKSSASLPIAETIPPTLSMHRSHSRIVHDDCLVDIDGMLSYDQSLEDVKKHGVKDWLRAEYERSRGFELGTFAPSILATTMKKQAVKRKEISLGYVSDAVVLVHKFVVTAIDALCYDETLKLALKNALHEGLQHRYHRAIEQVHFLLQVELHGTPMTANHYFNENLQNGGRLARMKAEIQRHVFDDCSHGKVVRLEDMLISHPMSNTSHIIEDIHDILKSYYKLVRKRFVDNIIEQATMHFLVTGPDTPLAFFSPTFVNSLTPGELNQIAGEAPRVRRQRVQLQKEIASLTGARDILARG